MARKQQTETQRLRKFGLVMATAFGLLGGLFLWRERAWGIYPLYVAAAFLGFSLLAPKLLAPSEKLWMGMARVLQTVVTAIILTLTFFLVMTPIGLLVRLTGKDLLGLRGDPEIESYWVPVEEDGPATRPDKPY